MKGTYIAMYRRVNGGTERRVDCKFAIEKDGKYIVDSVFLDYPLLITEIPKNLLGHWIFDEDNSSWADDVEDVYPQENNMIEYCLAEVI